MTDNQTTELRRLLDERGVEYTTNDHMGVYETSWNGFTAGQLSPNAKLIMVVTPELAIAATLGSEREKALEELVRDAYWLIARAVWTHESQDKFAADWTERMSVLGIEVD